MKKYYVKTFGCAMNQADSEKINMILLQSGFIKSDLLKNSDLIIFNTCSVRQKGEDRVFGMINEIIKERLKNKKNNISSPDLVVGVTGCMVRKTGLNSKYFENGNERNRAKKIELLKDSNGIFNNDDKLFPRICELDFTLRIEEIKYLPLLLSNIYKQNFSKDYLFDDYLKQKQLRENPSSVGIIIQTGCDNYCSYCIVPHTRGKEISRNKEEILEEINNAVLSGAKEITLIGQNVNSYGKQFGLNKYWDKQEGKWKNLNNTISPFRDLLNQIDKISGIDRIRFVSSNPHDMTNDILEAHFDLNNTCNHIHFALQSGSNTMLKKMNRKHTYEDFKQMIDYLRNKDPLFSISTDIIVGYSGETKEMFEETLKAIKECEFDFVYNSRYSVRKGTIAEKLYPDDISDEIKAKRWHKINELLKENVIKRNSLMLGKVEKILINGEKDGFYFGRTRNYKEVYFSSESILKIGDLVDVKLEKVDNFIIRGKKIN